MNKDVVHTHAHTQWNIIQPFKKVEIMPFAATWMETEIVILNEESQMVHAPPPGKPSKTEKNKYQTLRWHSGTEPTGQCRRCRRGAGSGKSPGSGKWQPTPESLPKEFHGQKSPVGYSSWGHKDSDRTEHVHAHTHTYTAYM